MFFEVIKMLKIKNENIQRLYENKVTRKYSMILERNIENKKASLLSDTMFKCMFVHENRLKYSCKLLAYYLNISYEELLKVLKLGKNELDKKQETDKGERADYIAFIHDSIINIEVNCNDSLEALERNMEYAYRLYSKKVKRGSNYKYSQVIQFNINNFAFENNDKTVDIYYIQNKDGIVLTDKIIFVQIFIPNIRKKWYNDGVDSLNDAERYLLLLIETSIEESKKLAKGDTIMEEYVNDAVSASHKEWFGEAYDKEWALKDQGIREGIEIGIEQGIEQEKKQMAEKMLQEKLDIKLIEKITGLTKQEILNEKNN